VVPDSVSWSPRIATSAAGTELEALLSEKERLEDCQQALSHKIGKAKRHGKDHSALIEENRKVSARLDEIEDILSETEADQSRSDTNRSLSTVVETTTDALLELRDDWTELMSQVNVYSPFMMWEWLYPWWETYGANGRLRLITVRDAGGQLVGLAPMMLGFTEDEVCDRKVLAFVGSGEEGPRGHYFGFIVAPEGQGEILRAIVEAVRELRSEWQVMKLWRMRQDDVYHACLHILSEYDDMGAIIEHSVTCARSALAPTMKDFIDSVPYRTRRQYLRSQGSKLKEKYASVRHEECTSLQELRRFLNAIHELNVHRYQTKGTPSAWLPARKKACFNEAARLLFGTDCLRAELLWIDGHPAAGLVGLIRNDTYFAFESGFAPPFAQDKVGHVLFGLCIEDCIKMGLNRFDWLSSYDYKYQYGCSDETLVQLTVFHDSSSSLRHAGSRLWLQGMARQIKRVLPWVPWSVLRKVVHRMR